MKKAAQQKIAKNEIKKCLLRIAYCVLLLLTFNFALLIFNFRGALAQSAARSFTISPPTLKFTLKPGQKTEKIFKITNNSAEAIDLTVDIQDFVVKDDAGTPELLPAGVLPDNRFSGAAWAMVLPDRFTMKPGEKTTTTLYLQVPGDAQPGGRYFSVTFKPVSGGNLQSSGAAVNTVIGSLVYLTVAGPANENARVTAFKTPGLSEYGPIAITTEIRNFGNIHVSPRGVVEIKNWLGRKSFSASLGDLNIFPGTSRTYITNWPKKWLFGRFTANLSGYYGAKNLPLLAVATFWVIPYRIILGALLAVAIAAAVYFYIRKTREAETEEKE